MHAIIVAWENLEGCFSFRGRACITHFFVECGHSCSSAPAVPFVPMSFSLLFAGVAVLFAGVTMGR